MTFFAHNFFLLTSWRLGVKNVAGSYSLRRCRIQRKKPRLSTRSGSARSLLIFPVDSVPHVVVWCMLANMKLFFPSFPFTFSPATVKIMPQSGNRGKKSNMFDFFSVLLEDRKQRVLTIHIEAIEGEKYEQQICCISIAACVDRTLG
jgi:hypothetical protein